MTKNKSQFLTTLLGVIFLLANAQNLAAQDSQTATKFVLSSAEESPQTDSKNNEAEEEITIDKTDPSRFSTVAIIQGLNKITAKTSLLEIKIGNTIRFGKLTITAHKCWQSSLDQKPESKILLEIFDDNSIEKNGEKGKNRIFYGWMFSSSPSVSALEHPIYDITAVGCKNKW